MPYKIIISGGGTGGHIFPAIAIANALKELEPETEILFVGAKGKMEMEKVPAAGYEIEGLWISGLQRKLSLDNLSFPLKLTSSVLKSLQIIKRFKPNAVVGVGGFASGPLMYAASLKRIPAIIQEQNSYPGITNKLLASRAKLICVAYPGMDKYFPKDKVRITGNPVRQSVVDIAGKKDEGYNFFGLDSSKKTILVVGGSLGALSINESIAKDLKRFAESDVQLIWQTGKTFYATAKDATEKLNNPGIKAFEFIYKMDLAYAVADVVVSRAGASAVSELSLVKKPCILVPYPYAAEDHQTKNAKALTDKNAAILIKDSDARSMLVNKALDLIKDEALQHALKENISTLGLSNSAIEIAQEVLNLCKN